MATDLITWLRAQLDEDERVAQDAGGATWGVGRTEKVEWGPMKPWSGGVYRDTQGQLWPQRWTDDASHIYASAPNKRMVADMTDRYSRPRNRPNAQHIARWDPARVLAEVATKRRIIDLAEKTKREHTAVDAGPNLAVLLESRLAYAEQSLSVLVLPYADRPGYQPEWAPTMESS